MQHNSPQIEEGNKEGTKKAAKNTPVIKESCSTTVVGGYDVYSSLKQNSAQAFLFTAGVENIATLVCRIPNTQDDYSNGIHPFHESKVSEEVQGKSSIRILASGQSSEVVSCNHSLENCNVVNVVSSGDHMVNASLKVDGKYFVCKNEGDVEEVIRKHSEDTFSHFVVAKKTKGYGSKTNINTNYKFRVHWQSRDLTSTEECAVQIPFEGVPFVYIGEKTYMCYFGRNKRKTNCLANKEAGVDYQNPNKKHWSRKTKKQGCPAKIFIKQIARFPSFKIFCNSEYTRTRMSQKLRKALIDKKGCVDHIMQFIGTLPNISQHRNHDIGKNIKLKEPVDPLIRDKIIEYTWQWGESISSEQIKELLECHIGELFKGRHVPSKQRRRYYPTEKDINNYIYKSKLLSRLTIAEAEQITKSVNSIQSNHPASKLLLEIGLNGNNPGLDSTDNLSSRHKFLIGYQSTNQQRLLGIYGEHVMIAAVNKHLLNAPFPLYVFLVQTNSDNQLVFFFISQDHSAGYLTQALTFLIEANPSWTPRFFCVDNCAEQISIIEKTFPKASVMISEYSIQKCWRQWLDSSHYFGEGSINADEIFIKLKAIANSFTEDLFNTAVQSLKDSLHWQESEALRNWFTSQWLTETKRWVSGSCHEEIMTGIHNEHGMNCELTKLWELHSSYIRSKRMIDLFSYLVNQYIPDSYRRYVDRNTESYHYVSSIKYQRDFPKWIIDKTEVFIKHVLENLKEALQLSLAVRQVKVGVFLVSHRISNHNTTFTVSLGNSTSFPSCNCIHWLRVKLPCVHMVFVLHNKFGNDLIGLSEMYSCHATLNIDFNAFDKDAEHCQINGRVNKDESYFSSIQTVMLPQESNGATITEEDSTIGDSLPILLDIDIVSDNINEADLEHGKILNTQAVISPKWKSSAQPMFGVTYVHENFKIPQHEPLFGVDDGDASQENSNGKKSSLGISQNFNNITKSHATDRYCESESSEKNSEIWVFDSELNVKLSKLDRISILCGQALSNKVVNCVQKILEHQFSDVRGLLNREKVTPCIRNEKLMRFHLLRDNHWSVSAAVGNVMDIFCCNQCCKSSMIEQVFQSHPFYTSTHRVLFVQRSEKEGFSNDCCVYAIAYAVAFLLDIDCRDLLFSGNDMRGHLTECIEDMCFSMFPVKVLKKKVI